VKKQIRARVTLGLGGMPAFRKTSQARVTIAGFAPFDFGFGQRAEQVLANVGELLVQMRYDADIARLRPAIAARQTGISDQLNLGALVEQRLRGFRLPLLQEIQVCRMQMDNHRLAWFELLNDFPHQLLNGEFARVDALMNETRGNRDRQLDSHLLHFVKTLPLLLLKGMADFIQVVKHTFESFALAFNIHL
jgi:hypothetical protein